MDTFKVAVLMPVFNGEKFVKKQILSILNQKNVDPTIFVSIDQSTDNSEKYLENLKKKFKKIKIVSKNLKFGSPTKNFFHLISNFKIKDFDYVSLSDQDDLWYPQKLIKSINILKNKNFSVYSSSVNAKIGSKRKYIKKSGNKTKFDYYFESAGPGSTYVFGKNFFSIFQKYLRKNIKKLCSFQHHDWLIYAYAREKDFRWYIDSKPSLDYIQHNSNHTGANIGILSFFKRLKEVVSGDALKKANDLKNLLKLKKIGIKNFHSLNSSLKLFLLSFSLRRSFSSKILISIYFFLLIFIGKNINGKRILSFKYFLNYIILIVFFLFFFKNFNEKLFYSLNINYNNSIYIFIVSLISLLIISYRILLTCNFFTPHRLKFSSWHREFCKSQIMNYLIPFSGIVYRGYLLKKSIKLSYLNYTKILIYLNILELFLIFSLVTTLYFYFNIGFQTLLVMFIILITCSYLIIIKNFDLLKFSFLNKIKKFKQFFPQNKNILNLKETLQITFFTILKILFNYILFLTIFLLIDIDMNYFEILVLTLINQIFEPIKITPQNIGLTELAFALFFSSVNNEPIVGSYIKIIHRSFEILNYFVYYVFDKAINFSK
tara:strand:- start:895 stop:2700 length:1806 start_codon:yes stop_codon:yes gene_type:complete